MPPPPSLTPAQLALQAERRALKEAKKAAAQAEAKAKAGPIAAIQNEGDKAKFLRRDWIASGKHDSTRPLRIVTWNLLAQTLVRRELFPGSDCLKWSDRKPMLLAELASYSSAEVICLQECDRLPDLAKALPTHDHVDTKGRGKLHGLVVMYRSDRFKTRASQTVYLDEERLSDKDGQEGRGGSRQTKNVGLIVGLEDKDGKGVVVATTHLFWHPKFAYERIRQSICLVRAMRRFQKVHGCEDWPAVLAGDLNTQPSEATYQLLSSPSTPLHPKTIVEVESSRLVHISTEAIGQAMPEGQQPSSGEAEGENEKDDEGELPDHDERSIAKTRPPREGDGVLQVEELVKMMQEILPTGATSTLSSTTSADHAPADDSAGQSQSGTETFGTRGGLEGMNGSGKDEPAYTCYTPLFKLTLDYIFLLPAISGDQVEVVEHLRRPRTDELGEGLPRKGICASDHLAMGCGLAM